MVTSLSINKFNLSVKTKLKRREKIIFNKLFQPTWESVAKVPKVVILQFNLNHSEDWHKDGKDLDLDRDRAQRRHLLM